MKCSLRYFLVLFFLTITIPRSLAGVITLGVVSGEGGTGSIKLITRPTSPVVDVQVNKTFTKLAPIDISFDIAPGANPLGIYNFSERIVNNTGSAWFDFHLELGTGTGDEFRVIDTTTNLLFTHATIPSECTTRLYPDFNVGLGADCAITPFRSTFSSTRPSTVLDYLTTSPDITAQNASAIETGHQLNVNFEIQVPNGIEKFTLREIPTTDGKVLPPSIPEPGTLAIFGLGLVGLGFVWRKKEEQKMKGLAITLQPNSAFQQTHAKSRASC